MSSPLTHDEVLFRQRLLRAAELYGGKLDGVWGPKTDEADTMWDDAHDDVVGVPVDARTVQHVRTLLPVAHAFTAHCLLALRRFGLLPRIISGTRTYAEQDRLYSQGRKGRIKEPIVTHARGGQSNHNFGIAWDVGLFTADGAYLPDHPDYDRLGTLWCPPGVEWGGNWSKGKRDRPHYQLATGYPIAELRRRFEAGEPLFKA